jgi:1-acyl-sn-glycerol-3-phosphate acyltransferase
VDDPSPSERAGAIARRIGLAARLRRGLTGVGRAATTLSLDLLVLKPLALFVWWFSQRANTIHFRERAALLRRTQRALAEGRPVLFAANHVSWFDDPVIPMALYRTGQRAGLELLALAALVAVCWLLPARLLAPQAGVGIAVAAAAGIAVLGTRKLWWTLGALENLLDASVLRGKLALTRKTAPGPFLRALLRVADAVIPWFMRSGTVRTIFVDRRPGEQARIVRARAVFSAAEVAERPEPVWVFFEGGRTKLPGEIAPARRGIGSLLLRLRERGHRPLVIVIYHEGMERLIPPGGSRFLSCGHTVQVGWSEFDVDRSPTAAEGDDQAVADAVREEALSVQARLRSQARERHPEVRPA